MPETVLDLGRKVKAKYPGQYDDLSDDEVGRKVKAKYPGEYDDFTDAGAEFPTSLAEFKRLRKEGKLELPSLPPSIFSSEVQPGFRRMTQGGAENVAGGASQILRGLGQAAAVPGLAIAAPFAPLATLLSLITGAGTGLAGRGVAQSLGAGPGVTDLAGDVTGLAGGAGGARVGSALRSIPFRATPEIVRSIPVVGRFIQAVREAIGPQAPTPFKPSPGVKRSMGKFGGRAEQEAGMPAKPGVSIPRKGPEPLPPTPTEEPFTPFKVNPNIARRLRAAPSAQEAGMPKSVAGRKPVGKALPPTPGAAPTSAPEAGTSSALPPTPSAPAALEGGKLYSASKSPRTELTSQVHALGRELDLPGSPAGKSVHISPTTKEIYGKPWQELEVEQMARITEFLHTHHRLPTAADIKSGQFKK